MVPRRFRPPVAFALGLSAITLMLLLSPSAPKALSAPSQSDFTFTVVCTPNPATTQTMVTCVATPAAGASTAGVTYLWNFGDSSAAAVGNPVQHQYVAAGTYL